MLEKDRKAKVTVVCYKTKKHWQTVCNHELPFSNLVYRVTFIYL